MDDAVRDQTVYEPCAELEEEERESGDARTFSYRSESHRVDGDDELSEPEMAMLNK